MSDNFEAAWVRDLLHDLRGPLATARGFLDHSLRRLAAGAVADVPDHLRRASNGVDRALGILEDISVLHALRRSGSKVALDPRVGLADVAQELRPQLERLEVALDTASSADEALEAGVPRVLARLVLGVALRAGAGGRLALEGGTDGPVIRAEVPEGTPSLEARPVPAEVDLARCLAEALGLRIQERYPDPRSWRILVGSPPPAPDEGE